MTGRAHVAPRGGDLPSFVPTFYPIVVAIAYLGLIFVGLGVSISSAARLFVVTAAALGVVSAAINVVMRDRNRGGVLCLVVVFLALFGMDRRIVALAFIVAALAIAERVISIQRVTRVPWRTITLVGNAVATILVLTLVITGVQNGAWGRVAAELAPQPAPAVGATGTSSDRPDIYAILLDGYERPDKMAELFGYDAGAFSDALARRGFEIASRSRSNYLVTSLSVPSLLNMRHIASMFAAQPMGDGRYRSLERSFSADNAVFRQMRALGYRTVSIASGFEEVAIRRADLIVDTGQLNEYELAMARDTAVGQLIGAFAPTFFADQQRARVNETLDAVADVARGPRDRPLFTFVHVPSPHGPIVFGPHGEPVQAPPLIRFFDDNAHDLGLARTAFGARYVGQIEYLNGRVLETVDRILAASPRPPVIIVFSDHGSGSGLNWENLDHSDLDERSANLVAAYTPGRSRVVPGDITLVNLFGTLFGAYFGIDVPRQPDTIYRWDQGLTHLVPIQRDWASR
jgi:sulfatase-like protein